jgi:GTPase SAR1 family protein
MSMTSISFSSFKQRREDLASAISKLKDLVVDQLDGHNVQQLDSLAQKVRDELQFIVLCVGDFSSGKTTFINKFLLHDEILPARARPTTTRLTTIRHGASLRATLLKKDGGSEIIADNVKQRIEDAVAAGGSEIEKVEQVLIEVPSPNLAEGFIVVDAPGLNDPDTLRMKVTLDFLHQADAILYFLNAQQAWTRSQKEFLEETILAREDLDKLFLLLNYWDLIEQAEREDVLSYVNEEIDTSLDRLRYKLDSDADVSKPDLIPVSAKTGENQDLVQEKIWDYLASKKGKDVLAYLVQRFNTYVDQYLEKLAERAKFLDEDLKQRETHCQQLGVEIEKYRIAKENFLAKLRQSLRPELENFRERISVIFDQNINLLQTEINNLQFECNDVAMVNKRLAAKLSYFQRRLASELGKAETQLFNIIRVRIEEQKSNLKIPPKRQQIWQDYISDWNTKPVVGNLTISGAGQIISAGTAVGGIGTFIGAASYTAATAETTIAATGWKALTAWFVGSEATTAAASSILTVGIPALAVAAIGISIFLALRHYSATETGRKVQFIGDELISKFEQVKIDVLSYIESNLEDRINEICANVDNDILTFYEQKRTEMDFLMLQSEQPHHHHAIEKNLSALKLPVNL